jgi:hypothetical protein
VVSRFTAVLFLFAAILFYSTYKILKEEEGSFDPGKSIAVKLLLQASRKTISTAVPEIPSSLRLAVIATVLAVSVGLSMLRPAPGPGGGPTADDDRPTAGRAGRNRPWSSGPHSSGEPPEAG